MSDKKIVLNEKTLTEEEFEKEKKRLEENKGVKVVEIRKDEYKSRIQE